MNRVTVLLKDVPHPARLSEIAMLIGAEHFGLDNPHWELSNSSPEDTPLHVLDQFKAEIRNSSIAEPYYLMVYGPPSAEDSDWTGDM